MNCVACCSLAIEGGQRPKVEVFKWILLILVYHNHDKLSYIHT